MLLRHVDWPTRLSAYVNERRWVPFAWGSNDCCTFALEGGVMALTGVDLLPGIPRPVSAISAMAFMNSRGHADSAGMADELLGERLASPKLAQRGDVVAMSADHGITLGLSIGSALVAPGVSAMMFLPRACAVAAWRV